MARLGAAVAPVRQALRPAAWGRRLAGVSATRLILAVTLLGAALRLYRYNALSLWFDEGVTLYLARLPWATIIGHLDAYDTHPPLYPALVKLLTLLLPEVVAGRLLSVAAGTLTIPVLYALTRRLLGTPVALLAAALLAVSPLHVWYSQEARPYAGVAFLVALSYLALVACHQTGRARWAAAYALATLAAVYYDYSALYALLPQLVLFIVFTRAHGRKMLPLWGAAGVAGLGFLPWAVKMVATVNGMTTARAPALGISPAKIGQTWLSLAGAASTDRYFLGSVPTPWDRGPQWDAVILPGLVLALLLGAAALIQRSRLAGLVAAALFAGTLLVGVAVSLYRPGFAERTVLAAGLGWALLAAAAAGVRGARVLRLLGLAGVVLLFVLSGLSLDAIYRGGDKDHWRDLAADTARVARFGWPIVTYHVVTPVLLDVYAPYLLTGGHLNVPEGGDLPALAQAGAPRDDAVVLDYIELAGIERVRDQLTQQGYTLLLHNSYGEHSLNPIYMDLYARPAAHILNDVAINGTFTGAGPVAAGWQMPAAGGRLEPAGAGGRALVLANAGPDESRAVRGVPAAPHGIYRLTFAARADLTSGRMRSFLICAAGDGSWAAIAPDAAGASIPNDGAWHTLSISVACPAATSMVLIDLRNAGQGAVRFRAVTLQALQPMR